MGKRLYRFEYVQEGRPGTVIATPLGGTFAEQVIIPTAQGAIVGLGAGILSGGLCWMTPFAAYSVPFALLAGGSVFTGIAAKYIDRAHDSMESDESEPELPELPPQPDGLKINGWRNHAPRPADTATSEPKLRADPNFFLFIHKAGLCEGGPSRDKLCAQSVPDHFSQSDYTRYTHRLVEVGLWKYKSPDNENLGFIPLVDAVKAAQMVRENRWHLWAAD